MATAEAYDQYDDPGMAFTDEQCAAYDPKAVAAVRVNALQNYAPLALRRSQLGEKAKWWEKVHAKILDVMSWYCVVAEIPGIDRELMHKLPTDDKELRKLTVDARNLGTEEEFVVRWHGEAVAEMMQHVTLGRRCSLSKKMSGWGKKERSLSNRVANAITKEISTIERLTEMLASRTVGKVTEMDDSVDSSEFEE